MQLELISFKLCPFVQRSVIVLNYKNIEYKIIHIELDNPPEWFKEISPLGKVPVLKVDDEVLFESAAISEFLDEVTPGSLLAEDAVIRAKQRGWIEFSSDLNMNMYELTGCANQDEFTKTRASIDNKLKSAGEIVQGGKWFTGDSLSLTDCAFAPFFLRARILSEFADDLLQDANIKNWAENLLSLPAVESSVVAEFKQMFTGMCKNRSRYLASRIAS